MNSKTATLILASLFVSMGMDCQGTMQVPEPMGVPIQIADGAYTGVVVSKLTFGSIGTQPPPITGTRYKVVNVTGGKIASVRHGSDANGPYDCWKIIPGEQRIIGALVSGNDANNEQTIVAASDLEFTFAVSLRLGSVSLTGDGMTAITPVDPDSISYSESIEATGGGDMLKDSVTGILNRIGDSGVLPPSKGMNGDWRIVDSSNNQILAVINIVGLRVVQFLDVNGLGNVLSSQPLSAGETIGAQVLMTFMVEQGGVGGTKITVSFQGLVETLNRVKGTLTATFPVGSPGVYDIILERVESVDCP